ncbi:MAG TPA: hypothetical protein VNA13_05135 [Xanthomonadales bacterium]|nr:hypothetical protein [Xanthomonadales bacterium]
MTSFIVASSDKKKREIYINDFLQNEGVDKFDITFVGLESSKNQNSIGIDEIKNLQVKIFLKPIQSERKTIIIEDADFLTVEAQNALLKVLEEPPNHTIIVLSVANIEALLPTILSRCKLVTLSAENLKLNPEEKIEFEEFIDNLSTMKVGKRLKKAENLAKDKDKAIEWIGKLILLLREKILTEARGTRDTRGTLDTLIVIKSFQELHTILKTTNVNPRFAIENTLLNLV